MSSRATFISAARRHVSSRTGINALQPAIATPCRQANQWLPRRDFHRTVCLKDSLPVQDLEPGGTTRHERIKNAKPFSDFLTDTFHRQHDYLRISVTERCNLRCVYCMPEEGVPLSPSKEILTTPEIVLLSSIFVSQGVTKIRLTGGEPTVRKDIVPMMHQIGELRRHGLKELCLTTNAISLHRKLDSMVEAGLTGVNLSLDTLDPFQFQIMTRRKGFDAVQRSIDRIFELNRHGAGIKLKINCVVMRGVNDREIMSFVEMTREKDVEVRFIEYMPFDGNKWSKKKMFGYEEMLDHIREKYPSLQKVKDHKNDTSKTWHIPGFAGRIGFITSMTHNFCGTCNRLRITSDGNLKVCLFGNAEVSLRDILRKLNNGEPIDEAAFEAIKQLSLQNPSLSQTADGPAAPFNQDELLNIIGMAVKRKKAKHAGIGELEHMKNRPMILIDSGLPSGRTPVIHDRHRPFATQPRWTGLALGPDMFAKPGSPTHLRLFSTSQRLGEKWGDKPPTPPKNNKPLTSPKNNEPLTSPKNNEPLTSPKNNESLKSPKSNEPLTSSNNKLTHVSDSGTARMVSVSEKAVTARVSTAACRVRFSTDTAINLIKENGMKKGDVLGVARIAGIMASKRTPDLIPLCHPIPISHVGVDLEVDPESNSIDIKATVSCDGKTGVEMEALTAASTAALTIYDMCKAVDKGMVVDGLRVTLKDGGKSGRWEMP